MARTLLHRSIWARSGNRADHQTHEVSCTNHVCRQYWWSALGNIDDEPKTTLNQANHSDLQKASPLVQYRHAQHSTINVPSRIYILGTGSIGGLVAHSLASLPHPPPITLLLHSKKRLSDWYEQGQSVKLITHGLLDTKIGFDAESIRRPAATTDSPSSEAEIIHNLIISVKAFQTVDALKRVAHRLRRESSIVFFQNGMGIIEEVNDLVFPDPAQRPQYMLGVISHGVYRENPFTIVHAGAGTIALAIIPRNVEEIKPIFAPSAFYLLRTLTRSPVLAAVGFPPTDFFQLQLEKLAVNAIINPLTALFDCLNGDLLHRPSISRIIRLLLAEISLVIKSLPELQGVPNVTTRFDIKRLEVLVISTAGKTAANRSSTLQDMERGNRTEIEYITGYIVRRGEEVGIQCVMNFMIKHMVLAKQNMKAESRGHLLPLESRDIG